MNTKRFSAAWLSLVLLAPLGAVAQEIPIELEVGYRWVNVNGNENMYRSQINERAGFLLRSFTLSTADFNGGISFTDKFRIDISDLGAGPAGSARLEMSKMGLYKLTVGYRVTEQFNALPTFANPLLSQGIIPGQHTVDRTRKMFDTNLEILPGKMITPVIGYSWNRNAGPAQTTYFLGQDEFRMNQNLTETENEVRVGLGFNLGSVYGMATQGWRQMKGTETFSLVPGAGAGNNPGPALDQSTVSATSITRSGNTDVNTPFTNIYVTGEVTKQIKLTGTYVQFSAHSDGLETEASAGSFLSFQLDRFFSGLSQSISADARNKTRQMGGRAEIGLTEGVDLIGGFQQNQREMTGTSMIDSLYLQSMTFGGLDQKDLRVLLNTQNMMVRDENIFNVGISARSIGPLAFRAEYRETQANVTVSPDMSEIIVASAGGQSGAADRTVRTLDAGLTFNQSGLMIGAFWKKDSATAPIFRTDFADRDRLRGRIAYTAPGDLIKGGFQIEQTNQSNDWVGMGYNGTSRQYTGDLEIAPVKQVRIRGSVSEFQTDSTISYRVPQNYLRGNSVNTENGDAIEGGLSLLFNPITFDAAIGRFENRGTSPFNIERYRYRLAWDVVAKTGIVAEYARDKFREATPSLGDYDATRFGLYLRWRP